VFENDIGLAFLDALDGPEAHALLSQRRIALAAQLAQARAIPPHGGSHQLVIQHLVHHLTAELTWLDEVLAGLVTSRIEPE
jgi:hypothetical protein